MARYTLWAINRALSFLPAMKATLQRRHDVLVGRRESGRSRVENGETIVDVNFNEQSAPGELMHEGALQAPLRSLHDEYFIPIPVKCIGDPQSLFWTQLPMQQGGLARLNTVAAASPAMQWLPAYFNPSQPGSLSPVFSDVHMNTKPDAYIGLYEVLWRASKVSGAKNILIGYSQGGLVARFLAWLDEHVAKDPCIAAVITVQAPNRGSPMAEAMNNPPALSALALAGLSTPGILPGHLADPLTKDLNGDPRKHGISLDALNAILDSAYLTLATTTPRPGQLELVRTARKWLSGLAGIEALAFYDLDPARLDQPDTVLSVLHDTAGTASTHQHVKHGAVIGSNGVLIDFVDSMVKSGLSWCKPVDALAKAGYWVFGRAKIRRAIAVADEIYKSDVMCIRATGPRASVLRDEIRTELEGTYGLNKPIPAWSHDFIIPAASQVMLPGNPGSFLGNLVNEDAGHLSGAELSDHGDNDQELVCKLLALI